MAGNPYPGYLPQPRSPLFTRRRDSLRVMIMLHEDEGKKLNHKELVINLYPTNAYGSDYPYIVCMSIFNSTIDFHNNII